MKIIWSEGMFLRQQHFQQQEQYLEAFIKQLSGMGLPDHWGCSELNVNKPFLKLQRFSLINAAGVFADGTPFMLNEQDGLQPLTIAENITPQKIYLCLPLSARYQQKVENIADSETTQATTAPIIVGVMDLQLRLEEDDRSACTSIAVASIKSCDKEQGIILDDEFIPPILSCQAAPLLTRAQQEITGLIQRRIELLAQRLVKPSLQGIADFSEWCLLQTLNRYDLEWQHATTRPQQHPLQFYQLGIRLLGELATFVTADKHWQQAIPYQQDDLAKTFIPLIENIRLLLNQAIEQSALALNLQKTEQGWWLSRQIPVETWEKGAIVLAIKGHLPPETLQKYAPGQTKVSARDQIEILTKTQLPGLPLNLLTTLPPAIPYYAGFTYFKAEPLQPHWDAIVHCGQCAVHMAGQLHDVELQGWLMRSEQ